MNVGFSTFKNNILIHDNTVEIYYRGFIKTVEEYDIALTCALKYLNNEGFLENKIAENIFIIDFSNKKVLREECL